MSILSLLADSGKEVQSLEVGEKYRMKSGDREWILDLQLRLM